MPPEGSLDQQEIEARREELERGTLRGRPRAVVRFLILSFMRVVLRTRLEHIERVPMSGGVLMVANHLHNADPVMISAAYPRPVHFMAKKEAFKIGLFPSLCLRLGGAFPVDRGRADRSAIKNAQKRLAAGIAVGIFPEGTRSVTRSLQKAHTGAGLLALTPGIAVQPVVITGTERLPLNGSKAKAAKGQPWPERGHAGVRILFGELFIIPREIDGQRVTTDMATEIIMVELARLLPPDYRGFYRAALENERVRRALPLDA